jgi:hypothetical protein
MRPIEIEAWALRVIERIAAGGQAEDARIDLKREWTDPSKAARQIAGHANAARGDRILWLIGVDETEGVVGADRQELANWWPAVESRFDGGVVPRVTDVAFDVEGKSVVALCFETDRAPFVVKNPAGGGFDRDVPWREGTRVRSATRLDLMRLLIPHLVLPQIEVLGGHFIFRLRKESSPGPKETMAGELELRLYVTPRGDSRVVIPFHQCSVSLEIAGCPNRATVRDVRLAPDYERPRLSIHPPAPPPRPLSHTIQGTPAEVLIDGPGLVFLRGTCDVVDFEVDYQTAEVAIEASLQPSRADIPIIISATLQPDVIDVNEDAERKYWHVFRWKV